jgi:hypothetical protein
MDVIIFRTKISVVQVLGIVCATIGPKSFWIYSVFGGFFFRSVLASSIMNVSEQAFQVYIKENSRDNIGVGGTLVSEKTK